MARTNVEPRLAAEVVVIGNGWSAVAAALAARAAGRSVLLAASGSSLPDETTVALRGDLGLPEAPATAELRRRLAAAGGERDGWLDPPLTELVTDRVLRDAGVELLLYAVPLALIEDGDHAAGVICGGKDGFFAIAAGAVVDATSDGALHLPADRAAAAEAAASRTIYFQHAGDELTGLPEQVAGWRLAVRPTWPGEACVTMTVAAGGGPGVHRGSRLAIPAVARAVRAAVPGLAEAVVSHTGHRLHVERHGGADSQRRHPRLANVFGAGAWVGGDGRLPALTAGGEAAGRAAAAALRAPRAVGAALPEPVDEATGVLVVGGGTGGALAAWAAGRQQVSTRLAEAGWFLGGIGTGGGIHVYYHGVKGGLQDQVDEATRTISDDLGGVAKVQGFSPEAKKIALEQFLTDAGVSVDYGVTLAGVTREGDTLTGALLVTPGKLLRLSAKATVDATGDGDVAARAGAPFLVGREKDGLNHAYTQSVGLMQGQKVAFTNFDAGYVDARDITDLTRARRHGIQLFWREEGFTPENRVLYLAPLLGIRQCRHVVADYQLTLGDESLGRTFDDVVAYGSCHYDNHAMDYENESDEAILWCWALGQWHRIMRHGVPYRSLLPQELEGLVMGCRALGVTHDAHMLFRMQRDMQRVGEAAGTAAGLAAALDVPPRQVPIDRLQQQLRLTGALLDDWQSGAVLEAADALVARLADPEPNDAVWHLYQHGEAAVPALLAALDGASPDARWWASVVLAMLGRREAEPALVAALSARDETRPYNQHAPADQPWVQRYIAPRWLAAIPLLGRIGGPEAVAAIAGALEWADQPDALIAAVRALGNLGDRAGIAALERLLARDDLPLAARLQDSNNVGGFRVARDTVWQLQLAIAEALGKLGVVRPELAEPFLDDERAYVRQHAHQVLDNLPGHRATGAVSGEVKVKGR